MKKLVTLMLAVLLIASMLAPAAMAEQTTVKFWSHVNVAWNDSWKALIADFEAANPDIKIEYTQFPYDEMSAKTQTALMAGEAGADVYEVWGGWMLDFAAAGARAEMPAELLGDIADDCYEPVLGSMTVDGKVYGAPLELNIEYGGLMVNKTLFEEAGLAYPTTWEEVMSIAKQVAVKDGETMTMRGLEFAGNDGLFFIWQALILQMGGELFDAEGKLNLNTEIAAEALAELVSWIAEDGVTNLDTNTGAQGIDMHGFLGIDECFMVQRGPWAISDVVASYGGVLGETFDYIPQPAFFEGVEQKWAAETGWYLAIAEKSEVKDAAWKFVEFVMQPENLVKHNLACDQIPPRKSVANSAEYIEAKPYMENVLETLNHVVYTGAYNTDIVKAYMQQAFMSLVNGDGTYADAAAACAAIQADIDANVKFY